MTAELDPQKIARLLTQSAGALGPDTLSALSERRRNALKRQSIHVRPFLLARFSDRWLVAALVAAIFALGANFWLDVREQQVADLDVAILTDDLPIEVFVD